jgi:ribonuclease-3 family protein
MLFTAMGEKEIDSLGILAVASVGDSVYDLLVRTRLCAGGASRAKDVHTLRVKQVNARAQAVAAERLLPLLGGEEAAVFRRGRNARPGNIPASANRAEYQAATALEALFGWLWLSGRHERLRALFQLTVDN